MIEEENNEKIKTLIIKSSIYSDPNNLIRISFKDMLRVYILTSQTSLNY